MGVLSDREIEENREAIFDPEHEPAAYENNFVEENLEPAAYNLRVGARSLEGRFIAIDGEIYNQDRDYPHPNGKIKLPERKISVLSTIEKLSFADRFVGRIGIRLKWSQKGIIPLFGPQVDPGYNDHFFAIVFNTNSDPVFIKEEDEFLKMEVSEIQNPPNADPRERPSSLEDRAEDMTAGNATSDLDERLDRLQEQQDEGGGRLEDLTDQLDELRTRVEEVQSGYRQVVNFGVFLIAASIFGVVLSMLAGMDPGSLSNEGVPSAIDTWLTLPRLVTVAIILYIIVWIYFSWKMGQAITGAAGEESRERGQDD